MATKTKLTDSQEAFIRACHTHMTVKEMAKEQNLPVYPLRRFMDQNGISTFAKSDVGPKKTLNRAQRDHKEGYFNVSERGGDLTWLV